MVHPSKYANRRTSHKMVCRVCLKDHPLRFCEKFLKVNYEERMRLVSEYKYCAGCLSHDHTWRTCKSTGKCKHCGDMHHTLLHKGKRPSSSGRKTTKRLRKGPSSSNSREKKGPRSSDGHGRESERPSSSRALVLSKSKSQNNRNQRKKQQVQKKKRNTESGSVSLPTYCVKQTVLLKPTAVIRIESNGRFVCERALIDPSAECSVISDEVVRRIAAKRFQVGGKERCALKMFGNHGSSAVIETFAEVRRKFNMMAPKASIDGNILDEFPGLQLADPLFNVSAPVGIILGGDVYTRIIRNGVYGGSFGKPLAQFTIFGYIVTGSCSP